MPSTLLMALARGRAARTGESCRHALNEIRLLQPGTPPIPPAADVHQAALESDFLEVIGKCPKDRWRPRMRPFGIKSVTPRPDGLTVRIAAEFLPDIIRDIAPAWRAEEEKDGEIVNMSGIPGLRALHRRGRTVLTRPGVPGRTITTCGSTGSATSAASSSSGPSASPTTPYLPGSSTRFSGSAARSHCSTGRHSLAATPVPSTG